MKVATNTAKLLRNVPLPDEIATVHDSAVVIDYGTGTTRIGFSGDDAPRLTAPTVVSGKGSDTLCFNDAHRERATQAVTPVMERGAITDAAGWDGFEQHMQYIYNLLDLKNDPTAPLLITESALVPKEQREAMVEILFEKVKLQSLYFSSAPVCSLFSYGRPTGIVVEMGHGTCNTVPVFEGFPLFHSVLQLDIGGSDLTQVVAKAIADRGVAFGSAHHADIAQYMKEMYCTVQPDKGAYAVSASDSNVEDTVEHTLPDGTRISLGTERYRPTEALFDPAVLARDFPDRAPEMEGLRGIHHLVVDSIRKCDQDVAPALFANVVLAGGTSLFRGLPERLHREVQELAPTEKVRAHAATERRSAAWVGASIFASLPTVQDMWVTKAEYDECGENTRKSIAHRNCF